MAKIERWAWAVAQGERRGSVGRRAKPGGSLQELDSPHRPNRRLDPNGMKESRLILSALTGLRLKALASGSGTILGTP